VICFESIVEVIYLAMIDRAIQQPRVLQPPNGAAPAQQDEISRKMTSSDPFDMPHIALPELFYNRAYRNETVCGE
jgi:hypothetical protein